MQPHRRFIKYARIDKINELDSTAGKIFTPYAHVLSPSKTSTRYLIFHLFQNPDPLFAMFNISKPALQIDKPWWKTSTLHLSHGYLDWGRLAAVIGLDSFRHVRLHANIITQLSGERKKGKVFVSLSRCPTMQTLTGSWG